ncbi:hypothetical protein [Rhizobium sp. NLR22b]|uniref:hypothetical protein n=1 Tax=Rhizobium sp. NLR22b TaxID=2731115 RepID=UPI002180A9CF|nr:hypothetical protein [Rhizobium sp. NLR22b]MBX5238650.1 hypothetical protein [Rhizobium sp. NLR22b]
MTEIFKLEAPKQKRARIRRGGWSWGPVEGAKLRVLSLGAGIQSTTLALMAAHGELDPMPDLAIVADMEELDATEATLSFLRSPNVLPFPIVKVGKDRLLSEDLKRRAEGTGRGVSVPFYTSRGQARRQCTREFKVEVIEAEVRRRLGYQPRQRIPPASAEIWIGYSTDEVVRAGAAFSPWVVHRFPLLEKRLSMRDCISWLERHDYPVPQRSKCVFCPFRTNTEWRWMQENEPHNWQKAVDIDNAVRAHGQLRVGGFLHPSLRPLDQADLSTAEERGQGNMLMVCEGGCGL